MRIIVTLIACALVAACSSSIADSDSYCSVHADLRVHCRCPDVQYIVIDSTPWLCGHPQSVGCKPESDCSQPIQCLSSDGSTMIVGDHTLNVTSADGACTDEHEIERVR